jgi:UDP-N-acetylglucosamine 3-dehydrogenase
VTGIECHGPSATDSRHGEGEDAVVSTLRVGIIGCGRPWKSEGASGFGMSHFHARGYRDSPHAEIVALADLVPEHAEAFRERHGGDAIYTDYRAMLASERLDMVSICTWPHLHGEMVIAAAEAGVKAIHCEKPMAPTWAEAKRMVQVCDGRGVQLTFNHQRRFGPEFVRAREVLRSGAIGVLVRLEGSCGNLFDWGTHWFDMFFFYNDEIPARWVLGQVERTGGASVFGVQVEGQAISQFAFDNGVTGILATNMREDGPPATRLVGTDGTIEVALRPDPLRVWAKGSPGWDVVALDGGSSLEETVALGVMDAVAALKVGREPELSSRKVLRATELIFATYESARRGGRIDLPLTVADATILATA